MVLISVSLIASEFEHHFICLLAICMSPWEKCLFQSSAQFKIGLFVVVVVVVIVELYEFFVYVGY